MKIQINKIHIPSKKKIFIIAAVLLLIVIVLIGIVIALNKKEETVYKETTVEYGILTVGIEQEGSIDIGLVEQKFELDMSALQRVKTDNSGNTTTGNSNRTGGGSIMESAGMGNNFGFMGDTGSVGNSSTGGNLNLFSQVLGMGENNVTNTGEESSITVDEVLVAVGQQVKTGDALYSLEEESVSELERELEENVTKAKADLDAVYAEQKLSKVSAEYTYKTNREYGAYAETEYTNYVQELQDNVDSAKTTMDRASNSLNTYQNKLANIISAYNDAVTVLNNCKYTLENTKPEEAYLYSLAFQSVKQAQTNADSLLKQKTQMENYVSQSQQTLDSATKNYNTALRNYEQGVLSAQQTYDLRVLAYNYAQESYDITLAYLEEDASAQEKIYASAKEKWDEYSTHISGNTVLAQYNGVVTEVGLTSGDSISTGSVLVSLYNMDDVSMTVSVYEEDMTNIAVGSEANVNLIAYPDEVFKATVKEISDATTDSNGNVLYEVTVNISGDVTGLFQGMTGEVVFITGQSEETLYVSKRAVITEKNQTYVKVRKEDGTIQQKEVTVGFTDGINIQILEGLSEGDIVLIESKVGKK